jgi:hypothetical protein
VLPIYIHVTYLKGSSELYVLLMTLVRTCEVFSFHTIS